MPHPTHPVTSSTTIDGTRLELLHLPAAPDSAAAQLPPIVMLHEGLGSVAMWRDFPHQLQATTGRSIWAYSRRGYGRSDGVPDVRGAGRLPPDYMHTEAWQVLPQLLLQCNIQAPVLLGHSDGGTIALLHAARHSVSACIVMAPHLFVEEISLQSIAASRQAFEHGDLRARLSKYHDDVDGAFWQWNDVWLSPAFRNFNIEAECQHISCPLLAIQGLDDPYGTMAQIDALKNPPNELQAAFTAKSRGLLAENKHRVLLKLEHCGHSPHRDQPEAVLAAVKDFLDRQVVASSD